MKMGVDFCPDNPNPRMSPRISFSHDLAQSDVVPVERTTSSPSTTDFDFCVFRESFNQEWSPADELFFDGKILPIEIKKRLSGDRQPRKVNKPPPSSASTHLRPPPPCPPNIIKTNNNNNNNNELKNPTNSKSEEKQTSFWRFKRSTSLNCGNGYARTLCPLPLLSRSNSTGSASSGNKRSSQQKQSFLRGNSSNTSQKQTGNNHTSRPPLKKNQHPSHSSGIRTKPAVLLVPSANFLKLGSFFSGGKIPIKKKNQ